MNVFQRDPQRDLFLVLGYGCKLLVIRVPGEVKAKYVQRDGQSLYMGCMYKIRLGYWIAYI